MSAIKTQRGGILIDDEAFKTIDGILTDKTKQSVVTANAITVCGLQVDGDTFGIVGNCITTKGTTTVPNQIKSTCGGLYFDSRYFAFYDGVLSLPHMTIKFNVTPPTATISMIDYNTETLIEPDEVGGNIYTVVAGGYEYTIRATGYMNYTDRLDATASQTIDITMVEASVITFDTTPADATVSVYSDGYPVEPDETGGKVYTLQTIDRIYTYEVNKSGYDTGTGSFNANAGNQTIAVTLNTSIAP